MTTAKVYNLKIVTRNVKHFPERELLSEFTKNFWSKDGHEREEIIY